MMETKNKSLMKGFVKVVFDLEMTFARKMEEFTVLCLFLTIESILLDVLYVFETVSL